MAGETSPQRVRLIVCLIQLIGVRKMKPLATFLVLFSVLSVRAQENSDWPPKPSVEGEWSEPSNQLRGRLLFADEVNNASIRHGLVYLELQNLKRVDIDLYYTVVPIRAGARPAKNTPAEAGFASLHCEVQNKNGDVRGLAGAGGFRGNAPQPRWILLPRGATLRFPVSLSGYSWPADTEMGFGIGIGRDSSWAIPKGADDPDDYFLSGELSIRPPVNREGHAAAWDGTIKLPAIKLPVRKPH